LNSLYEPPVVSTLPLTGTSLCPNRRVMGAECNHLIAFTDTFSRR
jgi:hypothetical protein